MLNNFIDSIKNYLKDIFTSYSTAEPINDESDYMRVKAWVKKTIKLFTIFTVLAAMEALIVWSIFGILVFAAKGTTETFLIIAYSFGLVVAGLAFFPTNWGYGVMFMHLPEVLKSLFQSMKVGYKIGEQVQTTRVQVTHEFGDTYRVSSHTDNQGCLFAVIGGGVRLLIWMVFSIYIAPYLLYKKVRDSMKNIKAYEETLL